MEKLIYRFTLAVLVLLQFPLLGESATENELMKRAMHLGGVSMEQDLSVSAFSDTLLAPQYQKASCDQAINNAVANLKSAVHAWQQENCSGDLVAEFGKPRLLAAESQYTLPPGYQEPSPQCLEQIDSRCIVHCAGGIGPMSGNFSRYQAKVQITVRCGKSSI